MNKPFAQICVQINKVIELENWKYEQLFLTYMQLYSNDLINKLR